jgi:hypothetical protein
MSVRVDLGGRRNLKKKNKRRPSTEGERRVNDQRGDPADTTIQREACTEVTRLQAGGRLRLGRVLKHTNN